MLKYRPVLQTYGRAKHRTSVRAMPPALSGRNLLRITSVQFKDNPYSAGRLARSTQAVASQGQPEVGEVGIRFLRGVASVLTTKPVEHSVATARRQIYFYERSTVALMSREHRQFRASDLSFIDLPPGKAS